MSMLVNSFFGGAHVFNWIAQEAVSDMVLNSNSGAWTDNTLRWAISDSQIDEAGNYIRLSYKGGSTEGLTINKAYVGIRSGTSGAVMVTPVQVLFGGSTSVVIPANTTQMSDPVPLVIAAGDGLAGTIYVPSGASANDSLLMRDVSGLGTTYVSVFKAGDDAATAGESGYSALIPTRLALDDLEIST